MNMGIQTISNHTYISETELRYFCGGERRIVQPQKDKNGNIVGQIDVTLTEEDLDNMIIYMRTNNLPFSLQVFRLVQNEYINAKNNSEKQTKPFSKILKHHN